MIAFHHLFADVSTHVFSQLCAFSIKKIVESDFSRSVQYSSFSSFLTVYLQIIHHHQIFRQSTLGRINVYPEYK